MGRPTRGYELRQLRSGVWQVRFTHKRQRVELGTGETDLDRAEEKARQLYAAVVSGRWAPGADLVAPGTPLVDVGAKWLTWVEPMLDKLTHRQYGYYVTAHWQPHFKSLDGIRTGTVQSYIRARLKAVKRVTLRKELSALRGLLSWAHEAGHLPEPHDIPKLRVKSGGTPDPRRRHKSKPIELAPADVEAILALLPEHSKGRKPFAVRAYFEVLYETGLRPSTVDGLEAEDLRGGKLFIRDENDKARFGRELPLTPRARLALERHAPAKGHIFAARTRALYLAEAAILAGKPGVTPRDFRHARATHWVDATGDILGAGYLLGHKQATTTNKYARQTQRAAERVLGFIGNVDVRKAGIEPALGDTQQEPESSHIAQIPAELGLTFASGDAIERPLTTDPRVRAFRALAWVWFDRMAS